MCIRYPNWHNIHNLKYSQNSTRAVPQVIVHNVPNVHKVPNQHIIYLTYSGWCFQPVLSRLCQIRLHHVSASSPQMLGPAWQVWTRFIWDLILGESVHSAVLHRPQHRPGSPRQSQTWPYGFSYSIVQETPAFAVLVYGVPKNGALNQFSHSLFIEIPWRDSMLARTEIKTRGCQDAAVGAV